jgi:hypothetical protein
MAAFDHFAAEVDVTPGSDPTEVACFSGFALGLCVSVALAEWLREYRLIDSGRIQWILWGVGLQLK